MSADHERIWLQAPADANETEGRMWCQDKVWPEDPEDSEPTEYVRADLFEALRSRLEARVATLSAAAATADDAMGEYIRYLDGGETRGSYDGTPERNALRKAYHALRAAREATR